jgi:hypothetical protein
MVTGHSNGDWRKWKTADIVFAARGSETEFRFRSKEGVRFNIKEMLDNVGTPPGRLVDAPEVFGSNPQLFSYVGAGNWAKSEDQNDGRFLQCDNEIRATELADKCANLQVSQWGTESETYTALPIVTNDRFCYRSLGRQWRSISHHAFPEGNYWVITDFNPDNPTSYVWMDYTVEIEKLASRGVVDAEDVLVRLARSGAIIAWWKEVANAPMISSTNGPNSFSIMCADISEISDAQCQGHCYYKGYPTAIQYKTTDRTYPGECFCATACESFGRSGTADYTLYKWFEGFFYDKATDKVWILGHTDIDDLNINLWVQYTDQCGNEGVDNVQFWIGPSLEAAAAQGRTCDETNEDIGDYLLPFAFTSDDVIDPSDGLDSTITDNDAAIQAALTIIQQGMGGPPSESIGGPPPPSFGGGGGGGLFH